MSLPSITAPGVLIWNSASEVSVTPAVVSFTPVGCHPVLLASGKPQARRFLMQFVLGGGGGAAGGWPALGFGADEPGCGAGVPAEADAGGGAADSEVHSDGASDGD